MTSLTLGFMPLTDCIPMVVAKHMGFFEKWGLDVTLVRQNSWATLRDKLHANLIEGAHMLAPMPFASALGLAGKRFDVVTPYVLSRQGNAITLASSIFDECAQLDHEGIEYSLPLPASRLLALIEKRAQQGSKLTFATVYPYSCHYYQLRTWLAQYNIPVDAVNILVIPPSKMVDAMKRKEIDGFCVGSPWNAQAVRSGIGVTVVTSCDIWPAMPEKVLGLTRRWCEDNEQSVISLIGALKEACAWLVPLPNRFEAARMLTDQAYLGARIDVLTPSLLGSCLTKSGHNPRAVPLYNLFGQENGTHDNCPSVSQGEWVLNQMVAAGHVSASSASKEFVADVFREDIYHCAINAHNLHRNCEELPA
jgi:NitT/TauT family transport system ATP-binding protein/nitrate/nitrite transport system substrate-binding protein